MRSIRIVLITIIVIYLLPPLSSIAENASEEETNFSTDILQSPMMNGKSWINMEPQSKIMYLRGLEDGAALLIAEMDSVQNEKGTARSACPALERLMIKGFKFSEIMAEIDLFYQQASNRRIPIIDAYRYVGKKFKGTSPEELASTQSELRRKYNK